MQSRKKLRALAGILKDRASLTKAALFARHPASMVKVAVLHATTHRTTTAPAEHRIAAVLSLTQDFPLVCIDSLINRLQRTSNAFVALKCLFSLHNIILQGWFFPKDDGNSFGGSFGGRNELNVCKFDDWFDVESREYSSWVRWYGEVLEENFVVSKNLGRRLFYTGRTKEDESRVRRSFDKDLLSELGALASLTQRVAGAPESLHLQRNDLMHEIVRSVCQDYRVIRRETMWRVEELGRRTEGLKSGELTRFLVELERVQGCEERLAMLFVNRANNDGFWELLARTKVRVLLLIQEKTHRLPRLSYV